MLSPSWINQFTAEASDSQWDDVEWLIKNLPEQDKEQTVELMETVNKKNQSRNKHEWFARDGQHPDRNGHKLLYDQVVDSMFTEDD